jgi:hypothetical protein
MSIKNVATLGLRAVFMGSFLLAFFAATNLTRAQGQNLGDHFGAYGESSLDLEASIDKILEGSLSTHELVDAIIAQDSDYWINRKQLELNRMRAGSCAGSWVYFIDQKLKAFLSLFGGSSPREDQERVIAKKDLKASLEASLKQRCESLRAVQKELNKRLQAKNYLMAYDSEEQPKEIQNDTTRSQNAFHDSRHDHSVRAPASMGRNSTKLP